MASEGVTNQAAAIRRYVKKQNAGNNRLRAGGIGKNGKMTKAGRRGVLAGAAKEARSATSQSRLSMRGRKTTVAARKRRVNRI